MLLIHSSFVINTILCQVLYTIFEVLIFRKFHIPDSDPVENMDTLYTACYTFFLYLF